MDQMHADAYAGLEYDSTGPTPLQSPVSSSHMDEDAPNSPIPAATAAADPPPLAAPRLAGLPAELIAMVVRHVAATSCPSTKDLHELACTCRVLSSAVRDHVGTTRNVEAYSLVEFIRKIAALPFSTGWGPVSATNPFSALPPAAVVTHLETLLDAEPLPVHLPLRHLTFIHSTAHTQPGVQLMALERNMRSYESTGVRQPDAQGILFDDLIVLDRVCELVFGSPRSRTDAASTTSSGSGGCAFPNLREITSITISGQFYDRNMLWTARSPFGPAKLAPGPHWMPQFLDVLFNHVAPLRQLRVRSSFPSTSMLPALHGPTPAAFRRLSTLELSPPFNVPATVFGRGLPRCMPGLRDLTLDMPKLTVAHLDALLALRLLSRLRVVSTLSSSGVAFPAPVPAEDDAPLPVVLHLKSLIVNLRASVHRAADLAPYLAKFFSKIHTAYLRFHGTVDFLRARALQPAARASVFPGVLPAGIKSLCLEGHANLSLPLASSLGEVERLTLRCCTVTMSPQTILPTPSLRHLALERVDQHQPADRGGAVGVYRAAKSLDVLAQLVLGAAPSLQSISFAHTALSDAVLASLLVSSPHLASLSLVHCPGITCDIARVIVATAERRDRDRRTAAALGEREPPPLAVRVDGSLHASNEQLWTPLTHLTVVDRARPRPQPAAAGGAATTTAYADGFPALSAPLFPYDAPDFGVPLPEYAGAGAGGAAAGGAAGAGGAGIHHVLAHMSTLPPPPPSGTLGTWDWAVGSYVFNEAPAAEPPMDEDELLDLAAANAAAAAAAAGDGAAGFALPMFDGATDDEDDGDDELDSDGMDADATDYGDDHGSDGDDDFDDGYFDDGFGTGFAGYYNPWFFGGGGGYSPSTVSGVSNHDDDHDHPAETDEDDVDDGVGASLAAPLFDYDPSSDVDMDVDEGGTSPSAPMGVSAEEIVAALAVLEEEMAGGPSPSYSPLDADAAHVASTPHDDEMGGGGAESELDELDFDEEPSHGRPLSPPAPSQFLASFGSQQPNDAASGGGAGPAAHASVAGPSSAGTLFHHHHHHHHHGASSSSGSFSPSPPPKSKRQRRRE
ncbi:hypothetical protein H9P43_001764 [Blastocladiella emersonii ATCC 22665]|nr:hypothetical protein H9P43_001764 [Blastocladiella emersonii ATCC 22665]